MGRLKDIDENAAPTSILAPTELSEGIAIGEVLLRLQDVHTQWCREREALPGDALRERRAYTWAIAALQRYLRKLDERAEVAERTGERDATRTVDVLISFVESRIAAIPRNKSRPEHKQVQVRLMRQVRQILEGMK